MTKLKKIIIENNISQKQLYNLISEKCHTPIGYDRISKIVNGKITNYSLFTLLKFCIALDCTPNDIIDREPFLKEDCLR